MGPHNLDVWIAQSWRQAIHAKRDLWRATAHFTVPPSIDQKLGEHLARLALAREALLQVRRAARRLDRPFARVAERLLDTVNEQIAAATKSNSMVQGGLHGIFLGACVHKLFKIPSPTRAPMQIYHETVPKAAALPPLPSLSSALVTSQLPAAPRADDASSCLAPVDVAAYWLVPAASLGPWRMCQDKVTKAVENTRRRCSEMDEALARYGRMHLGSGLCNVSHCHPPLAACRCTQGGSGAGRRDQSHVAGGRPAMLGP